MHPLTDSEPATLQLLLLRRDGSSRGSERRVGTPPDDGAGVRSWPPGTSRELMRGPGADRVSRARAASVVRGAREPMAARRGVL